MSDMQYICIPGESQIHRDETVQQRINKLIKWGDLLNDDRKKLMNEMKELLPLTQDENTKERARQLFMEKSKEVEEIDKTHQRIAKGVEFLNSQTRLFVNSIKK